MKISGLEGLHKHLPDYTENQVKHLVLRLPLFSILFLLIQTICLYIIQFISREFNSFITDFLETGIPIINNIIFIFFGTITAQQGFRMKDKLQAINREYAFQRIVKKILLGISMVFAGVLFGYIPITNPSANFAIFFNKYFESYISDIDFSPIKYIIGILFLIIGGSTAFRAIQDFGIDTASMVYVYFPEDAKIIENNLYFMVRHPMYLAVFLVSFGSFIFYFSTYSLILLIITLLSFYRHIVFVEDRELKERFGEDFEEYVNKTPAIFIRPHNWGKFFKFLIRGKLEKKREKIHIS